MCVAGSACGTRCGRRLKAGTDRPAIAPSRRRAEWRPGSGRQAGRRQSTLRRLRCSVADDGQTIVIETGPSTTASHADDVCLRWYPMAEPIELLKRSCGRAPAFRARDRSRAGSTCTRASMRRCRWARRPHGADRHRHRVSRGVRRPGAAALGLSAKGVGVAFGTIDADYRGEVLVTMWTFGDPATRSDGDRIAQLVVTRLAPLDVVVRWPS